MRIGIVGGGVIGLCTAYYLNKLGADPVIVESSTLGGGCSLGNAGWVFPSKSTPLAKPGLTLQSLKWMLRRDSPLHIRPSALAALAPWLMRFRSYCNHADQMRGIAAFAALNAVTMERYDELAADGVQYEYSESGLLMAFRDFDEAAATKKEVDMVAAAEAASGAISVTASGTTSGTASGAMSGTASGATPRTESAATSGAVSGVIFRAASGAMSRTSSCRELDEAELYEREPLLRPGFRFGLFLDEGRHVRPESVTGGLGSLLRASGIEIHQGTTATGFRSERQCVTAIATSLGDLEVDSVVLAAGAYTGSLSRMVGCPIPLIAGKGYSVTIEQPTNQLRQPLLLGDGLIGLSPFKGALRFAGTLELSGIDNRMDAARVRSIRRHVSRALDIPEASEGGRAWMGMRPMVPDSLPVIGKLPSRENVYVNTGHQMSGITVAPSSGWALAGLMLEGKAGVELKAFSAERF